MLKALLMSEDLKTGLIAYDLLSQKVKEQDCIKLLSAEKPIPPYNRPEEEREAYLIFIKYVLSGDLGSAMRTANEFDSDALNNIKALQMLQGLLACEDRRTAKKAYEVLAGITSLKQMSKENEGMFFDFVSRSDSKKAFEAANVKQAEAMLSKERPEYNFKLQSIENYHRLNYIMLDQKLTLNEVLNTMIESFYQVLRADEHAQLMGEDTPQIYYI